MSSSHIVATVCRLGVGGPGSFSFSQSSPYFTSHELLKMPMGRNERSSLIGDSDDGSLCSNTECHEFDSLDSDDGNETTSSHKRKRTENDEQLAMVRIFLNIFLPLLTHS